MRIDFQNGKTIDAASIEFEPDGILVDGSDRYPYADCVRATDDPEPEVHPILKSGTCGYFRMEEFSDVLCNFGAADVICIFTNSPHFDLNDAYFTYVPFGNFIFSLNTVPETDLELISLIKESKAARKEKKGE